MRQRTIVCPIIENNDEYLICKMSDDRGVFPGQWALPGGGIEPGEKMLDALTREINEELGDSLNITKISPWSFRDDIREKTYKDGTKEKIYMIYLIFDCKSSNRDISFNDEFQEVAWVSKDKLNEFNLNEATKITFTEKGFIK